MKPRIGEFKLGEVYGENEVKFLDNYMDFYYDLNNAQMKILDKRKFVVIGRKGTGKTLLAHVVCENLKKDYSIASVESLKEFVFHELTCFQGVDISPTKYVPIFEWMIYINLAKHIVKSKGSFNEEKVQILEAFLKYFGHVGGDLKVEKTIEMTKKLKGGASADLKLFDFGLGINGSSEDTVKEGNRSYLENIENLKEFITLTLYENNSSAIIFYDELDDKFSDDTEYKSGIISFLNAITKVNNNFLDRKVNTKVCSVIRSDIVNKLNASNINKIFEDNSVFLSWDASFVQDTELFEMLAHKVRKSSKFYRSYDTDRILENILPSKVANEPTKVYILHRTLGRPRDIIRMLSLIQEDYGHNLDRFEAVTFTKTLKKYSSYLKREIKSELIGHVSDKNIDHYFTLLTKIGKRAFSYDLASQKFDELELEAKGINLKEILSNLFKAGAICNVIRQSKHDGGNQFFWSYNDEDLEVNFDYNFEIHPGLWDTLYIQKPKNRLG